MVDMRKYASGYVMPDDLRDGPRQEQIINVYISEKHDVPVLEFASGDQLFAWPSIARVLTHAYGFESDNWRGHTEEKSLLVRSKFYSAGKSMLSGQLQRRRLQRCIILGSGVISVIDAQSDARANR